MTDREKIKENDLEQKIAKLEIENDALRERLKKINSYIKVSIVTDNIIANAKNAFNRNLAEWKRKANDYKQRAEVAEKERNEWERKTEIAQKAGKIIQQVMLRVFSSENPVINDKINTLWDLALQEAECEIKENTIRQAILTVEEDTQ